MRRNTWLNHLYRNLFLSLRPYSRRDKIIFNYKKNFFSTFKLFSSVKLLLFFQNICRNSQFLSLKKIKVSNKITQKKQQKNWLDKLYQNKYKYKKKYFNNRIKEFHYLYKKMRYKISSTKFIKKKPNLKFNF